MLKCVTREMVYSFVHKVMFSLCWLLALLYSVSNDSGVPSAYVSSITAGFLLLPDNRSGQNCLGHGQDWLRTTPGLEEQKA
jgi:hypothetical protein